MHDCAHVPHRTIGGHQLNNEIRTPTATGAGAPQATQVLQSCRWHPPKCAIQCTALLMHQPTATARQAGQCIGRWVRAAHLLWQLAAPLDNTNGTAAAIARDAAITLDVATAAPAASNAWHCCGWRCRCCSAAGRLLGYCCTAAAAADSACRHCSVSHTQQ
jgi:hypothetical protein